MEKEIEKALVHEVKKCGGMCIKINSLSMDGLPDRMVLLPKQKIGFVELKDKNKKPRAIQVKRMKDIKSLGFYVNVLDDKNQIGAVIEEIKGGDAR